ncbi:hypothetical protein [Gracilimonas amylolytica]|uniref:hypothetical protein n=1 Tax=Gracilimonas amylolytica TaxID=1749045 RepID=UPI000CD854E2|nr:hypothetical protein [Gracilimonas amylolytica]
MAESRNNLMAISGMDKVDEGAYLAVYDLKSFEEGSRLSVIEVDPASGIKVQPVLINDWKHEDGAGSDLESVCRLPDRENEFLIAESGRWDGEYGRLFHLKLVNASSSYNADILGVIELPEFDAKGPDDPAGDEIEGLACFSTLNNELIVLFGERGGSDAYTDGLIRWAQADLRSYKLKWATEGKTGVAVNAPGNWTNSSLNRDISGLHIDEALNIWAVASEELGENGPFNSIVYRIGKVNGDNNKPVILSDSLEVYKELSGFKAEAIAAGTDSIPGSRLTIGTEDEQLGGTWRVLN